MNDFIYMKGNDTVNLCLKTALVKRNRMAVIRFIDRTQNISIHNKAHGQLRFDVQKSHAF